MGLIGLVGWRAEDRTEALKAADRPNVTWSGGPDSRACLVWSGQNPALHSAFCTPNTAMDFLLDGLSDGRRLRAVTLIDDFTRECLAIVTCPQNQDRPL